MDRGTAELEPGLRALDALSEEIASQEERREFRRRLAHIMTLTSFDLVMHVVRQFPDLDPDK